MRIGLLLGILLSFTSHVSAQSSVTFWVRDIPLDAPQVGIRGDTPPLSWQRSIPLEKTAQGYRVSLSFPASSKVVEFKFVLFQNDEEPTWESNQNRTVSLQEGQEITSQNIWNTEQVVDIEALPLLEPEALLADFELIRKMVLSVHPGTFRYNSEETIHAALEALKEQLSRPQSYGEAYLAMSKLTAQIKCDHTKVGFNNQNRLINSVIHYQKDKLPFAFKWIDEEMIVTYNASEANIPRGSAILSIDGRPVKEILSALMPYVAADGNTDSNRIYKLSVSGYDFRYNAFDIFYPLRFPLKTDSIRLEVQPFGEMAAKVLFVKPLTRDERSDILEKRYPDFPKNRDDLWSFKQINPEVALLTLNSFGLIGWKAMTLDYKAFLREAFGELREKNIPNLIIDIRENMGGNDEMKDELYGYLSETIRYDYQRESRSRFIQFPEDLKPHIRTWGENPWFYHISPDQVDSLDGYYIFRGRGNARVIKNTKAIYEGKTFLLTSSANTSLAYYTAAQFKGQKLGLIVGQETGGNLNDINGGQILFLTLPNSTIEIDVPIVGGFAIQKQPNSGVVPHLKVTENRSDIALDQDPVMETVLALIKQKQDRKNR